MLPLRRIRRLCFCVPMLVVLGCGNGEPPSITFDAADPPSAVSTSTTTTDTTTPATEIVEAPWVDVTANLAGMASECGNLSRVAAHPDRDEVVVAVARQGLWVNRAGDEGWARLAAGAPEAPITNRAASIIFDPDVPDRFWESGHYGLLGAFRSDDGGRSFVALGDLEHLDGLSVDFTDPQRRTLLAGSHERADLYRSTDGGSTWTNLADRLPADVGFATQPLVLSSQIHLLGTTFAPTSGIFRSTDGGNTWERVAAMSVGGPPTIASDGSIYWMTEGASGLLRSDDDGATWTPVTGAGVFSAQNVVELPDGRLASVGRTHLIVSDDRGSTWRALGSPIPTNGAFGLTYSAPRDAVYIWQWDCTDEVPAGSVQRLDLAELAD